MEDLQYINKFLYNLSSMQALYNKTFEPAKEKLGLSMGEIDVLLFLSNNPKYNIATEIVKYRKLSKSYISKAVTTLKDRGLLRIDSDLQDGRIQHLLVTKKADDLVERLNEQLNGFYSMLTKNVSVKELEKFIEIADKLADNVREPVEGGKDLR